ncbi:NADH-FMN oxidoreductase RutF, flavin reductase (DIM6/NTAB) family [Oscillospiraceae bacterium]|nr:NADH-FMN oxidoreductase RutF, flavin reductase (DIM6/NTAB) family [Oscillospiraceae bacterium]
MGKISLKPNNDYCPQTLFLYGTYDENGSPDFGLFCWFSYIWDGEMGVMCAIGGDKLTKQNIKRNKVFSANLVTEALLPIADYLGCTNGSDPDKMKIDLDIGKGEVLDVPILNSSPVNFELEVTDMIPKKDGDVILCKIRNVLQDESLSSDETVEQKLARIAPVRTTAKTYLSYEGRAMGSWGEPMKSVKIKKKA